MDYLGNIRVVPQLPEKLSRLKDFAYNLYYSWHSDVRDLFIAIDKDLWTNVNHNPVKFLSEVEQNKMEKKAHDTEYIKKLNKAAKAFDAYINETDTWFAKNRPDFAGKKIAYFTAEFGFHESLPIYAGGLGVLAGDHLKSASDLGFPIVGVSLYYNKTYFTQEIDVHGNQIANYKGVEPEELPLIPCRKNDGTPLLVTVPVANRGVQVKIWEVKIGRISAYLLDTNIPENNPADREITSRLYGGDQEMRISQEIILGMGGVIALEALGIMPDAWHMNEGHSVFLALERIKRLVESKHLTFDEALEAVTANTIFTTHTPVPAGNDAFPLHIKDKYFQKYWESVGIRRHQFMELGSQIQPEGYEIFNLTILSLNLSRFRNAVSKLHGDVSRSLWKTVWPDIPSHEVPITHITNGVHANSWTARKFKELYDIHLSDWQEKQDSPEYWSNVDNIPDEEMWKIKLDLKKRMLNHIKDRLNTQYQRNKEGSLQLLRVHQLMKPDVLTIGFARRFATYKRATLIFRNLDRLRKILNNPDHPVQLVFSGKAHPKDKGGQDLIRHIYQMSLSPEFRGKIVFVENYDMGLARDLVSGVDIWLNNPRRTQEASGTSGQKCGMNGTINFSVLDGWWCEGFNGNNGWAFGDREDFNSLEELDSWDGEQLYDILENDIIPVYYRRNENNVPAEWIKLMKNSIKSVMPVFNTHRMVKEYLAKLYVPAIQLGDLYREKDFNISREIAKWRERVEGRWSEVAIEDYSVEPSDKGAVQMNYGGEIKINARVSLGPLEHEDVKVQIFLEKHDNFGSRKSAYEVFDMNFVEKQADGKYRYQAVVKPTDSGNYQYTLRVLPYHKNMASDMEFGIAKWARKTEKY